MNYFLLLIAFAAGPWTESVDVYHDEDKCVSYQARIDGSYLVIKATLGPNWHTYSIDNKVRAEEKLAGKEILGIDQPTRITLTGGLSATGGWLQTPPKDMSKPALNWFSWGYETEAVFVTKVKGSGPTKIGIRGQSCNATSCRNVDTAIELPAATLTSETGLDLKALIPVREKR